MAGSVWYPQVNRALKGKIPTIVKTLNESQELVPIPVIIRTPEPEFSVETFPSATIYPYDEKFSLNRYTEGKVVVSIDEAQGTAVVEDSAKPYSLFYQIDFWAHYEQDIDQMVMAWNSVFTKHNVIEVVDSLGVTRKCYMKLVKYTKADTVRNKTERLFHRIYSYEIWVELDTVQQTTVPIVKTQEIAIKEV